MQQSARLRGFPPGGSLLFVWDLCMIYAAILHESPIDL